jgi:Zn finger protein HypA/HybF involved in hydrogenase expression
MARLVEVPMRVVLACTTCQTTWEPDLIDVAAGNTGCPTCGGWTWIAQLAEPDRVTSSGHGPPVCPKVPR